ncbi:Gfo/Idh/MocA family protein [Streptomyces sp. PU_AKi4]|uniref:Gfo/Idh/MocA family protein n=1 Tax=Streptomyces sp. PU_AKi4 TaxID=2800809 RepID=UPI003526AF9A
MRLLCSDHEREPGTLRVGSAHPVVPQLSEKRPPGAGLVSCPYGTRRAAERSHLPALRAVPGYELRALSASSRQSAERSGQKHGVSRAFGTAAELAACDEVDLVVVAVKVPHHRELVRTALSAGRSVLCEWPLGNGLAEAEDMARSARGRAVPTVVGLQARSHPVLAYARHLVADGYVGEVLSTTVVGSGGAWGATVGPGDHHVLDAANGATLLTVPFGHALDGLASVLGEPEELRIRQVSRRTSAVDTESGRPVPMTAADQVVASGRLPGGAVAHAYRQFLDDLREGTSRVPDFAHGVARHRSIASVTTAA